MSRLDSLAIGLDIGATKTLGVLVDAEGRVLEQVREATEPGPDGVVRTAVRVVAHLGAATGAPATSVGLGIPGLVDVERGAVKHAVNLGVDGEWVPLRAELESRGVIFTPDTIDSGVCHMAYFADPDGNALMLHNRYAPRD